MAERLAHPLTRAGLCALKCLPLTDCVRCLCGVDAALGAEGFATWMENFATDHLYPDWHLWDQFVYSDVNEALSLDSLESSHPIEVTVERAEDVDEIFDAISYSKGSVVVRLLEDYLGADTFRAGIREYIRHFAYKNATTEDLWAQLQKTSNKPVREMMERWTKHVGFPLLTLTEAKEEDGSIVYGVTQRRFLINGVDEKDDTLWFVPVSFLTSHAKGPVSKQILRERDGHLRLDGAGRLAELKWVKINPYQTGPYRVHYPASMLQQFKEAIGRGGEGLTASDRLGLQSDLFALARAGIIRTAAVLEFIECYREEEAFVVWADLLGNLAEVADLLKLRDDLYTPYCAFVRRLIERIIAKVGWEQKASDDHCAALLRARVLGAGVKYKDEGIKAEAQKRFAEYVKSVHAAGGGGGGGGGEEEEEEEEEEGEVAPTRRRRRCPPTSARRPTPRWWSTGARRATSSCCSCNRRQTCRRRRCAACRRWVPPPTRSSSRGRWTTPFPRPSAARMRRPSSRVWQPTATRRRPRGRTSCSTGTRCSSASGAPRASAASSASSATSAATTRRTRSSTSSTLTRRPPPARP